MSTNTLTQRMYSFPPIRCKEGSAWHNWSTVGAVFAKLADKDEHYNLELSHAAELFAGEGDIPRGSALYETRYKAFRAGASNVDQLTELKEVRP